jgi:hypothetical protein
MRADPGIAAVPETDSSYRPDEELEPFTSTPQTALNCGYCAIYHSLQMLGFEVPEIGEFVAAQSARLMIEAAHAPMSPAGRVAHPAADEVGGFLKGIV